MPRKMIYIDNHIGHSKTLKDKGFFQLLSRSLEHPLPKQRLIRISKINSREVAQILKKIKSHK